MLFLLPCIDNRATESNVEPLSNDDDDVDDDTENQPPASTSVPTPRRKKTLKHRPDIDAADKALIKALEATNADEDTNFALSIVPSLRVLSPEEKLDTKIGILNLFKQVMAKRRHQTTAASYQRTNYGSHSHFPPVQNVVEMPNLTSPGGCSNDTIHSYYSNFSHDSELLNM